MKTIRIIFLFASLFFSSLSQAAFIAPDNAVATVGGDLGGLYDVGNIIDGSGLDVHDQTGVLPGNINANANTVFYSAGNTTGTISFSFNTPQQSVDSFYLWQPVHSGGSTNRGIQNFTLEFFNGATSLGITSILTATEYLAAQANYGVETFSGFGFSNVTRVDLVVLSNYGDPTYYSIHEVGFNVNALPVAAAAVPTLHEWALILLVFLLLLISVFFSRKRQSQV